MPNYQVITKADFAGQRWLRCNNYQFAATDAVAPLVADELSTACMHMPIAFLRQAEEFVPVATQSLQAGKNLFVVPDTGRWYGGYVPAIYRSYPFTLAPTDDGQQVLCMDMDSGLLSEYGEETFFDDSGEPSPAIANLLAFLRNVDSSRQLVRRMCAALQAAELIVPWSLSIKSGEQERAVEGLYCVDEKAFNALETDALNDLHKAGALPLVYCQLLSMQHIKLLGKLAEAHAQHQATAAPSGADLESLLAEDPDNLTFNF